MAHTSKVRYGVKFRPSTGLLVLKVTDDTTVSRSGLAVSSTLSHIHHPFLGRPTNTAGTICQFNSSSRACSSSFPGTLQRRHRLIVSNHRANKPSV
jgi:hypothetical protein